MITDQPANVAYVATLPPRSDTTVRGTIKAYTSGGRLYFNVDLTGLPPNSTYPYHIHDQPVPANGNCTATLAHLDPYSRGEDPPCDPSAPQTCQVGDLAGKHGRAMPMGSTGSFSASYSDAFVDANPGRGAFFGNRSIVVHFANKTRITCANFYPVPGMMGYNGTMGMPRPTGNTTTVYTCPTAPGKPGNPGNPGNPGGPYGPGTPPTTAAPRPPQYTGGAEGRLVGAGAVIAIGLGALALML